PRFWNLLLFPQRAREPVRNWRRLADRKRRRAAVAVRAASRCLLPDSQNSEAAALAWNPSALMVLYKDCVNCELPDSQNCKTALSCGIRAFDEKTAMASIIGGARDLQARLDRRYV